MKHQTVGRTLPEETPLLIEETPHETKETPLQSSNNNRGNPTDQESPVDFLDSTFTASADHSMSLKDVAQPRSSHQVVYHKGHPTSNAILLYHDAKREVVQQCIANLMSQFHDHYEHVEVTADSYCDKQRHYLDLAKSRGRIGSIAGPQCLYQLYILCN